MSLPFEDSAVLPPGGPFQPLDADLTAIAALGTTGLLSRTASDTWALTSGTAGRLLFWAAGALVPDDDAALFWDDTNKRLGIGTSAPGAQFEIAQSVDNPDFHMTATGLVNFPQVEIARDRPGGVLSSQTLVELNVFGAYSSGVLADAFQLRVDAAEDFVTSQGVDVLFQSAAIGDAAVAERLRLASDGRVVATGNLVAPQIVSTVAIGTAPLVVTSTTAVSNLNADLLDGSHAAAFLLLAGRAGSANNALLSTDDDGIITGSSASAKCLRLRGSSTPDSQQSLLLQDHVTDVGGPRALVCMPANLEINAAGAAVNVFTVGEDETLTHQTWVVTTNLASAFGVGLRAYVHAATIKNPNGVAITDMGANPLFFNACTHQADGAACTVPAVVSLLDQPVFNVINAGTLTATAVSSVYSIPTIGSGATVTDRRGLRYANKQGSGTQTNSIAVEVEDQTVGTLACSLRSVGAGVQMRHVGGARFGTNTAPDTILHVGASSSLRGAVTFEEDSTTPGNPSSGSQMRVYMKSNSFVIQYNDAGTVRYKYLDLTGTGVTWTHSTSAP